MTDKITTRLNKSNLGTEEYGKPKGFPKMPGSFSDKVAKGAKIYEKAGEIEAQVGIMPASAKK